MLRQIRRARPYRLALVLFVAASMHNAARAATKDDLTPDARQRFEQLREELRKVNEQVEDAKQRAYAEDPLLLRAKEGIDQSRKLQSEAGREGAKVKQFLADKGKEARRAYRQWQSHYGEIQDYESFEAASQDLQLRPLLSFFAKSMLAEWKQRKSPNALDLIRKDLPPNDAEFTSERALELYSLLLQRNAGKAATKLVELEKQISPPASLRQHVKKRARAGGLFIVCDTYHRLKMPEYVAQAKKECKAKSNELIPQLNQIWPGWEKAEVRE